MASTNSFARRRPSTRSTRRPSRASLFRTTMINADLGLSRKYGLKQTVIDPAHFQPAAELKRFSKKDARALLELYEVIGIRGGERPADVADQRRRPRDQEHRRLRLPLAPL